MHTTDTTPWLREETTPERRATVRHPGPCTMLAMAAAVAIVGHAATAHAQFSTTCQRIGQFTYCDTTGGYNNGIAPLPPNLGITNPFATNHPNLMEIDRAVIENQRRRQGW